MIKPLFKIACVALFIYLLLTFLLYLFQRNFLYFPTDQYDHPFDKMEVSSENETIEIIILNKGNDKALIYFGGNAESVVANAHDFSTNFSDITTYLVNYRGYGGSTGKPTEDGNYADALAIYDEINKSHSQISVIGRSLGSGIATYLAVNRSIEKIALITPYDSILNVAKSNYFVFPVKFLLKDVYDSASRAKDIKSNVLVISAQNDQVIPRFHTQNLIDAFETDQVLLKVIENTGHNDISNNTEYYEVLRDLFD